MHAARPVRALAERSRSFGPAAAREKLALLDEIAGIRRFAARDLRRLHDTLDFLRAYPDSPALRGRVADAITRLREHAESPALLDTGFPGSANVYAYSYAVLQRLTRLFPGCLEIDWEDVADEAPLLDGLGLIVTRGEYQGLEDVQITLQAWFDGVKPDPARTDLEFLIALLEESGLSPQVQAHLYEVCDLPIRYDLTRPGTGRCEVLFEPGRIRYQKRDIGHDRFPLAPRILRPLRGTVEEAGRARGRLFLDVSLAALCSRKLEIYPLIYANPDDVRILDLGGGLRLGLAGVLPEYRSALETLCFFLVLKNGVPIAYGPASVFLGCCEMGINLFPEFRGGEIRSIYAGLMQALHHLLGARHFHLTRYAMGEDNEDALASGAFWFYRKLGFVATDADVEALARSEEERMRAAPGHRSDRRMLRRLSHTEASLDLSQGECRPIDLGRLGVLSSLHLGSRYGADRVRARKRTAARIARVLEIPRKGPALAALPVLAPLLSMLPGLESWSARDKALLRRIIRAKGARSEATAAKLFARHGRLERALRGLLDGSAATASSES